MSEPEPGKKNQPPSVEQARDTGRRVAGIVLNSLFTEGALGSTGLDLPTTASYKQRNVDEAKALYYDLKSKGKVPQSVNTPERYLFWKDSNLWDQLRAQFPEQNLDEWFEGFKEELRNNS